jgi:hypothetical protein
VKVDWEVLLGKLNMKVGISVVAKAPMEVAYLG